MKIIENIKTYWMNVSSSYLPFAIQIIGSICFTPLFIKALGPEQYGLFILVNTIIGYFGLCDIGFAQAFTYKVIGYLEKEEKGKIDTLVSSVFYYYLGAGILINVAVGLFLWFEFGSSSFEADLYRFFKTGLITLSLSYVAILLSQVFERLLFAKNRVYKVNFIKSLQQLAILILNLSVLALSRDLELIFFSHLTINVICCLIMYLFSKKEHPYSIQVANISKSAFFSIANSSWWFFIGTLSYLLLFQTDVFVITTLFDLKTVALYAIYYKFIHLFLTMLTKPVENLIPTIAAKFSNQEHHKIIQSHLYILGITAVSAVAITIILLKPGYFFLQWWIGPEVVNNYGLYLPFILYFVLYSIDNVSSTFLYAMCLHKNSVIMGLVNGVLNLALSLIFASYMGISGVIWGSIASLLLTSFWYNIYHLKTALSAKKKLVTT